MSPSGQRATIDRLRDIPLDTILRRCGAKPDPHDRAKWHTTAGVLSVNGVKFINWKLGHGGGGAIDLVMHLHDANFRTALDWLAQRFPHHDTSVMAPPVSKRRFTLPPSDPSNLSKVNHYLLTERHLPIASVDPLIQAGKVYADTRANAVFLLLDQAHQAVGAELRGTLPGLCWRGLAAGSCKDLGCFEAGSASSNNVILCESAIDAISCATLYPGNRCISTSGARDNPAWLPLLLIQGCRIACGFDADPTGDHMANTMIARHPAIHRLRPSRHDWNDVLLASC